MGAQHQKHLHKCTAIKIIKTPLEYFEQLVERLVSLYSVVNPICASPTPDQTRAAGAHRLARPKHPWQGKSKPMKIHEFAWTIGKITIYALRQCRSRFGCASSVFRIQPTQIGKATDSVLWRRLIPKIMWYMKGIRRFILTELPALDSSVYLIGIIALREQIRSEARVCHFGFQFLRWS